MYQAVDANAPDSLRVHLHLNKTVFLSGEQIGFTAYLYNTKQLSLPESAKRLSVMLLTAQGRIVEERLLLVDRGVISDRFSLSDSLPGGDYFLRASVGPDLHINRNGVYFQQIRILNLNETGQEIIPDVTSEKPMYAIETAPEGGSYVAGIPAVCVYRVLVPHSSLPGSMRVELLEEKSQKKINLSNANAFGMGKFSFIPEASKSYLVRVRLKDTILSKKIMPPAEKGFSMVVSQNYRKKYVLISVSAKVADLKPNEGRYYLKMVGGSEELFKKELHFRDRSTAEMIINMSDMLPGINTISLMNAEGTEFLRRPVFNYESIPEELEANVVLKPEGDSVSIRLSLPDSKLRPGRYSLSVLPGGTLSLPNRNSLFYSLFIEDWMKADEVLDDYFLEGFKTVGIRNYLDIWLLLKDRSTLLKKDEASVLKGTNEIAHTGFTVRGTINLIRQRKEKYSVLLYSNGSKLFETVALDSAGSFKFNNVNIYRGDEVKISLVNEKGKIVDAPVVYSVFPAKNGDQAVEVPEIKPLQLNVSRVYETMNSLITEDTVQELDEVVVTSTKLKYEKQLFGPYYGRKIDSTFAGFGNLENLLITYGYKRTYVPPTPSSRPGRDGWVFVRRSARGELMFPVIIYNGVYYDDPTGILTTPIETVDEVYYKRNNRRDGGTFFIFSQRKDDLLKKEAGTFVLREGFDRPQVYVESIADYNSLFEGFGTYKWEPSVTFDEQGTILFSVPKKGFKTLKIILEGITADGHLVTIERDLVIPSD